MERTILDFYRDEDDDWVANLDYGHGQHARHHPPFVNRPWVQSAEGRAGMLGKQLECLKCERLELPQGLTAYQRTPEFDETSIPPGLRRTHSTKSGVWGLIHVLAGELHYEAQALEPITQTLVPGAPGVVVPQMLHQVEASGVVRFHVEFLRLPSA